MMEQQEVKEEDRRKGLRLVSNLVFLFPRYYPCLFSLLSWKSGGCLERQGRTGGCVRGRDAMASFPTFYAFEIIGYGTVSCF